MRVLAALSGGVDSAVAAARAVDAGHDVTAVHLALSAAPATLREGARGCCTQEDARDARRAADALGVPFYVWDLAERFRADVVEDFVAEYAAGRTPNPCLRCNEKIKFAAVLDKALALGFDAVCTGHYARLERTPAGPVLRRAVDADKDQSYVLAVLTPAQLDGAMFPLGDTRKSDVRAEADARGLLLAQKPDSHDVCFIPDGDTGAYLRRALGDAPGDVVDADGTVLGRHSGAFAYTVGQRRGLNLGVPSADGRPRYVLEVSPVDRRVTVGPAEALDVDEVVTGAPVWCGSAPTLPLACTVQLRAHGGVAAAVLQGGPEGLLARLDAPVRGIAPGQALVAYDGDRVVGSATVESTASGTPSSTASETPSSTASGAVVGR